MLAVESYSCSSRILHEAAVVTRCERSICTIVIAYATAVTCANHHSSMLVQCCCKCAYAGFFYHYVTTPARKANFPDPCSEHSLYLEYGSDKGLFSFPKEE
jgi:hypothetical protein